MGKADFSKDDYDIDHSTNEGSFFIFITCFIITCRTAHISRLANTVAACNCHAPSVCDICSTHSRYPAHMLFRKGCDDKL